MEHLEENTALGAISNQIKSKAAMKVHNIKRHKDILSVFYFWLNY